LLLDALSTATEVNKAVKKKHKTSNAMKGGMKRMLLKASTGSQSFHITSPKLFGARKTSGVNDDGTKVSTNVSIIDDRHSDHEPSSPSIKSKKSRKLTV